MDQNGRRLLGLQIPQFILSGDAIFTLKSQKSGKHMTFRVRLADGKTDFWFVSVLTGPDNTTQYTYIGTVKNDFYNSRLNFKWGEKSRIGKDADSVSAMHWFFDQVNRRTMSDTMEVWHEGRCCICALKLTDPVSIDRGIGPKCYGDRMKKVTKCTTYS